MIRDISSGKLMIVSDLHGNGYDFRQVHKVYQTLKAKGKADYLVFLGDLIHAYPGKQKDESLEMIEDLMDLKANQAESDVICLLGNHEFVHIYHIPLAKGQLEFTSWFEYRIQKCREEVIRFFMDMPLMLRTQGGTLINHTGASNRYENQGDISLKELKDFNHQDGFTKHLEGIKTFDPQIGSEFMNTTKGDFLWDILMNGNEKQFGEDYHGFVDRLLQLTSDDRQEQPLNTLVSGHIAAEYGAEVVGERHLRICTSAGALGDLEKKFLLIDAAKTYKDAAELIEYCRDLY
ncbi:metallophosphoesterase family protein [Marinifilum caeruleilacunae]|uniref:Metallophosphatase family protein n=1 Tax=Marinifilum caeruleilacunae TaxID=2499076 RepID=A0ABX1WYF8_9BACT|nr:metallophosphoesterase family protein [Marinifilum caeruleilacunae]NOU60923.1 metallophosphatase family protein [Marinifilum caeruleilacunae]